MNSKIHPVIRRAAAGLFGVGATILLGNNVARGSGAGASASKVGLPSFSLGGSSTIVVNSLLDTTAANAHSSGQCTLRKAIANAQAEGDTTGGDCADGASGNTIIFNLSGSINLQSNLPAFNKSTLATTIDGSGHSVEIFGSGPAGPSTLDVESGRLNLKALTVAFGKGSSGGALKVGSAGAATVTQSTFADNYAGKHGGAVYVAAGGTLSVANTSFFGNVGNSSGDAILDAGTLTVANSSFAFNGSSSAAGHGVIQTSSGTASIYLSNTLLTQNNSDSNCQLANGLTDGGGNISTDPSCGFSLATSKNGDRKPEVNAVEGPLYLGGPSLTVALLGSADARSYGLTSTCSGGRVAGLDQRGYARPSASCDTGAYDSQGTAPANTPGSVAIAPGASTAGVTLTWQQQAGDTSYNVYEANAFGLTTLLQSGITVGSYTSPSLNSGEAYTFVVAGVDAAGAETFAPAAYYAPPATGFTGAGSDGGATLSWTYVYSSGAYDTYSLYEVSSNGTKTLVSSDIYNDPYVVSGLTNGTTYEFVLVTNVGTAASAYSSPVYVTVGSAPFSFISAAGAAGAAVTSSPITLSSIKAPLPITIDAGYFCINSQPCSNVATTVQPNDVVSVQLNAPLVSGTSATANVVIGGVSGSFTVSTQ